MSYTRIGNMAYYSAFSENVKGYFCFFDKYLLDGLAICGAIAAQLSTGLLIRPCPAFVFQTVVSPFP